MATRTRRARNRLSATQARAARRARRRARRRILRIAAGAIVGAVALAFIAALFLPGLPISIGRSAPDGSGVKVPDQGNEHTTLGQGHPAYNSIPATSGWHYAQPEAPVRWGVHDDFVADEYRVHNLEHGGIGIHYNCPEGCDELVQQLSNLVETVAGEVFLSPYPEMDTRIALTAWTFIDKFNELDEERIKAFIAAYENSPVAPEAGAR